ncbi:hypothetical protein FRB95_014110 [Tulasnella sp. JGI-2019a]|nr:hypothetical protein FRB95_014110 [Tulasnella sp. JGI-2019a]
MAIRRVAENPDPSLLSDPNKPRFQQSLRLLQYLRDVHSDSDSAEALDKWTEALINTLERIPEEVNGLVALSRAYKILNSITAERIATLQDVNDASFDYFFNKNSDIKSRLKGMLKAAQSVYMGRGGQKPSPEEVQQSGRLMRAFKQADPNPAPPSQEPVSLSQQEPELPENKSTREGFWTGLLKEYEDAVRRDLRRKDRYRQRTEKERPTVLIPPPSFPNRKPGDYMTNLPPS